MIVNKVLSLEGVETAPKGIARRLAFSLAFLITTFFVLVSLNTAIIIVYVGDYTYAILAAPLLAAVAVVSFLFAFKVSPASLCPSSKLERFGTDDSLQQIVESAARRLNFNPRKVKGVLVRHPTYNCGAFPQKDGTVTVWITSPLFEMYTPEEAELQLTSQLVNATNENLLKSGRNEALCYIIYKYSAVVALLAFFALFVFIPAGALFFIIVYTYVKWRVRRLGVHRTKVADLLTIASCQNGKFIDPDALITSQLKLAEMSSKRMGVMWSRKADPFAALTLSKAARGLKNSMIDPTTVNSESRAKVTFRAEHVDAILTGQGKLSYSTTLLTSLRMKDIWHVPAAVPLQDVFKGKQDFSYMSPVPLEGESFFMSRGSDTPPGWYNAPNGEPGLFRWWDGNVWTSHTTNNPQVVTLPVDAVDPNYSSENVTPTTMGWYDDPDGQQDTFCWWNGKEWTHHKAQKGDEILLTNPTRVMRRD